MSRLAWVFLAFWIAGIADYMTQSLYFGWPTFGLPNASTGLHIAWWLDWLPRDLWHWTEAAHNALYLGGAGLAGWTLRDRARPWAAVPVMGGQP